MPEGFKEGAETLVSAHSFLLVEYFLFFRLFLYILGCQHNIPSPLFWERVRERGQT